MKKAIPLLLIIAFGFAPATWSSERKRVDVPGTRVSLVPPDGFEKSDDVPGFELKKKNCRITVTEINVPYERVVANLTPEGLRQKNLKLLKKETVAVNGKSGILYHLLREDSSPRTLLLFGGPLHSILITGNFPKEHEDVLSPAVRRCLLSAKWDKNKVVGPLDGLDFRIQETKKLKISKRLRNVIMLTPSVVQPLLTVGEPVLAIARGKPKAPIADRKEFANTLLRDTQGVKELKSSGQKAITVNGLEGFENTADAADKTTGVPVRVYQAVLFTPNAYYRFQGIVGQKLKKTYLPEFRKVVESFRRKKR